MATTRQATGYARLAPWQARLVLAGWLAAAACFVGITLSPLAKSNAGKPPRGPSDLVLYRGEIERIRQGQGYYDAAQAELAARGYPTRSIFNWRLPLPMWLIGKLPDPVFGKALLGLLAAGLIFLSYEAVARERESGVARPLACAILLTGPVLPCVLDGLFVTPELWSGILIALSLAATATRRPAWGVVAGILAVFFRELALPYCLLAAGFAAWQGRQRELLGWVLGLAAWAVYFGFHAWQVVPRIAPDAVAHRQGWIQFGGAAFVLSAAQMNAYLLLLPDWITALYFTAAMFGLAGWDTPFGRRLALCVAVFVAAFGVVGQDFNQYWGLMIAPLYCFGVARFPASLGDLWTQARIGKATTSTGPSGESSREPGALCPRRT